MTPTTIVEVTLRRNGIGLGWFLIVQTANGEKHTVGSSGSIGEFPIMDPTIAAAEVSRWTARLMLGREYS